MELNELSNEKREDIYKMAGKHFGETAQIICAIEEMSELNVELSKLLNGKRKISDSREAVVDEIADVFIMIEQLVLMLDFEKEVDKRVKTKLERLKIRIENG